MVPRFAEREVAILDPAAEREGVAAAAAAAVGGGILSVALVEQDEVVAYAGVQCVVPRAAEVEFGGRAAVQRVVPFAAPQEIMASVAM